MTNEEFKELRQRLCLNQTELAQIFGVKSGAVCDVERGARQRPTKIWASFIKYLYEVPRRKQLTVATFMENWPHQHILCHRIEDDGAESDTIMAASAARSVAWVPLHYVGLNYDNAGRKYLYESKELASEDGNHYCVRV